MTWKVELEIWGDEPDNTKVWYRRIDGDKIWKRTLGPTWSTKNLWVVDNEWAELRMSQADGRQLQIKYGVGDVGQQLWDDQELSMMDMCITASSDWRVKPVEPVYEWQWTYKNAGSNKIGITDWFYTEDDPLRECYPVYPIERYEPSKREKQ